MRVVLFPPSCMPYGTRGSSRAVFDSRHFCETPFLANLFVVNTRDLLSSNQVMQSECCRRFPAGARNRQCLRFVPRLRFLFDRRKHVVNNRALRWPRANSRLFLARLLNSGKGQRDRPDDDHVGVEMGCRKSNRCG